MDIQTFTAFLLFSIAMSLTPGAGNITLLSISNRYGFTTALPFVAGTNFGVLMVFVGASAGVISLLTLYPPLYTLMKYAGAAYLLYIAWGMARFTLAEEPTTEKPTTEKVSGFTAGTLIQVLNPKAWIAAMTVFSQFTVVSDNYSIQIVMITLIFVLVTVLCTLAWAYFGSVLKKILKSPRQLLLVNRSLAVILVVSVAMMLT